jgi:metallo-beta-lactamase class B
MRQPVLRALRLVASAALPLSAQTRDSAAAHTATPICESCAAWNAPQNPFRIYGGTYYVGVHGLSAILITSKDGHVLIDGDLAESVPSILANIRALGFRVEDVKLILNSHVHFDHAGGIAELQRLSGASVVASAWSAEVLRRGSSGRDDPQYGVLAPIAPLATVRVVADRETLRVGPLAVTAYLTPGHTPGGTSWTWRSCEAGRCLDMVYADSQSPVSADAFLFTRNTTYPSVLQDFANSFAVLDRLPCSILITPHPEVSGLWNRLARREAGDADALVDPSACKRYATAARERLAQRVAAEKAKQ